MLSESSAESVSKPPALVRRSAGVHPLALRVLFTNLPFALALMFGSNLPQPLEPLVVGAIMFLAPGLAWVDRRCGDAAVVLFRVVLASFAASFVAWLAMFLLPGPTSRIGFLLVLAAITNAGLWRGARAGFYSANPFGAPLARALTVASALFYLQCYSAAAYFVPPLEDLDMELQATAYGMVHELQPTMTTNDGARFYFAHPVLLHALIAESFFISDDLDRVKYYHEGSVAMGDPPAAEDEDNPVYMQWADATYARWEADLEHFMREPAMVPTRTPNLFLSAFLMFPLGFLAYRLSGAFGAAFIACGLYATFPEVFVRASYGGYMAIANFLTLAGTYFYLAASSLLPARDVPLPAALVSRRSAFAAAFLGGWADQKTVLLPMAALAHAGLRVLREGKLAQLVQRLRALPEVRAGLVVGLGFFAGWLTYIAYGLSVDWDEFIQHHLRLHVMDRIAMDDVNLKDVPEGEWVYPSIVALWQQFADHTGYLIVAVAIPALVRGAKRLREADGVFFLWVAIAAVGFSLTDWRQTKHLQQFLPAFTLLIGVYWASLRGTWRTALSGVLAAAVVWNVARVGMLMNDFEYLKPLPIW